MGGPVPVVREELAFSYDETWKLASRGEIQGRSVIMEFVRRDDDIRDWKEVLTGQNFSCRPDRERARRMDPETVGRENRAADVAACLHIARGRRVLLIQPVHDDVEAYLPLPAVSAPTVEALRCRKPVLV
jgi:hypothetical protein